MCAQMSGYLGKSPALAGSHNANPEPGIAISRLASMKKIKSPDARFKRY